MSNQSREAVSHWTAAALCAVIVFLGIFRMGSAPLNPMMAYLPMCFVFVGLVTWHQRKQIRELQKQVAELRQALALPALEEPIEEQPAPGFQITLLQVLIIVTFAALLMGVVMAVLRG